MNNIRRGLTLIELLLVIGILAILVSLLIPSLASIRSKGRATKSLANMRTFGLGLSSYCSQSRDVVPAFYSPKWPPEAPFQFDFGPMGSGNWFDHVALFALAVTAELEDTRVAVAPGNPEPYPTQMHKSRSVSNSDYLLSETLYASPKFFNAKTMLGVEQWAPQRLADIQFPSQKGIMVQKRLYHFPQYGVVLGCCSTNIPSPVLFGDLSAAEEDIGAMPVGIFNPYVRSSIGPAIDPIGLPGAAIMETVDGIAGRDRGVPRNRS